MFLPHLVRKTLEKSDGAFQLYLEDRVSTLVLAVNLRAHARDLAPFDDELSEAVAGFAAEVEATSPVDAKESIRKLHRRFEAWLREARAHVDARERGVPVSEVEVEPKRVPGSSGIDVAAAAAAVKAESGPSDEEIRRRAMAEIEALGLGTEDFDEVAGMTSDDIEKLLKG